MWHASQTFSNILPIDELEPFLIHGFSKECDTADYIIEYV